MGAKLIEMGSFNRGQWLRNAAGFMGRLTHPRAEKSALLPLHAQQTKVSNKYETFKNMEKNNECISRPVRVRFKKSNETVEGNIMFYSTLHRPVILTRPLTMVNFRLNDAQKTETSFSLMDIDMIDYL